MISGVLTPAYGRDYTSLKKAQEDFDAGKDFMLNSYNGSGYCSITDFTDSGLEVIQVRYNNNKETGFLKIKKS